MKPLPKEPRDTRRGAVLMAVLVILAIIASLSARRAGRLRGSLTAARTFEAKTQAEMLAASLDAFASPDRPPPATVAIGGRTAQIDADGDRFVVRLLVSADESKPADGAKRADEPPVVLAAAATRTAAPASADDPPAEENAR